MGEGMTRAELMEIGGKDGSWGVAFPITSALAFDCSPICQQNHSLIQVSHRSKGMPYE